MPGTLNVGYLAKKDVVSQAQSQLDFQKQENQRLKSALAYSKTPEFIEKQARDKLFMTKQGEQKILIPKNHKTLRAYRIKKMSLIGRNGLNYFLTLSVLEVSSTC